MVLLAEISGKLAAAGVCSSSGANGWALVRNWLPDSTAVADKMVALIDTGGSTPMLPVEIDKPTWQVLVRGDSMARVAGAAETAKAEADAIYGVLHGLGGVLLPTSSAAGARYYVQVQALQSPALLRYDEQQRPVYVTNYMAWRSRT